MERNCACVEKVCFKMREASLRISHPFLTWKKYIGGISAISVRINTKKNFKTTQRCSFFIGIDILGEKVVELSNKTVCLCLIFCKLSIYLHKNGKRKAL